MPTPSLTRASNHRTGVVPAARSTSRFFRGTTDATTNLSILRRLTNRRKLVLENFSVGTRFGWRIFSRDENANFVNELLMSISR